MQPRRCWAAAVHDYQHLARMHVEEAGEWGSNMKFVSASPFLKGPRPSPLGPQFRSEITAWKPVQGSEDGGS